METIQDLMAELDGADEEKVRRIAWEKGSLPVRLAMLGLAAIRKGIMPLWYGYPPGVFISYKWAEPMKALVLALARHLRDLGYRAVLDVENLDDDADAYFRIPQFITSLQDCTYYLLLLTELSADFITARKGKMTWIHDEYDHAVRLVNQGG
jgi:TIR domain